ncbi:hypothetical protein D3C86_1245080 [compost metagenome]
MLCAFLLAVVNQPLSWKAGAALTVLVMLTTGVGLLLIPVLQYAPFSGVLVVGLGLFVTFRYGLRGGSNLVATFLAVGLTMIPAAGVFEFNLALEVVSALAKGMLMAVAVLALCHWLFPEAAGAAAPTPAALPALQATWIALRAALVVMPAFLLALTDPAGYTPVLMKAVSLGRQTCTTTARDAGRELLGSTLLGGVLAMLFWCALSLFVHLWMLFLWMLLFALLLARKLYRLSPTRLAPGFWLNTLVTLIILLGQSIQDSAAGKDVYTAFAVRMALFIGITLYAWLMVYWLEGSRWAQAEAPPTAPPPPG